jgi:hypothetical protein
LGALCRNRTVTAVTRSGYCDGISLACRALSADTRQTRFHDCCRDINGDCSDRFADYRLRPIWEAACGATCCWSKARQIRKPSTKTAPGCSSCGVCRAGPQPGLAGTLRPWRPRAPCRTIRRPLSLGWGGRVCRPRCWPLNPRAFCSSLGRRCGRFHPCIAKLQRAFARAAMIRFMHCTAWRQDEALKTIVEGEPIALLPHSTGCALLSVLDVYQLRE